MSSKNNIISNIIREFVSLFTNLFIKNRLKLITYDECTSIITMLQPGDIIVTRTEYILSNYIIPGFWKHVAVYIGNNEIIEAVYPNVRKDSVFNLIMHTHNIMILRMNKLPKDTISEFVEVVKSYVGRKYDQGLNTSNDKTLYCSEVVLDGINKVTNSSYIEPKLSWGYPTYSPNDIVENKAQFDFVGAILRRDDGQI